MNTKMRSTITAGILTLGMFLNNKPIATAQELAPLPPLPQPRFEKQIIIDKSDKDFEDLKSKQVSVEVNAGKNGEVSIDNTSRELEIKTWNESKVKVVTTIYYEGDAGSLSDADWFEKLNLTVKSLGSSVRIKSGTVSGGGSYQSMGNSYAWSSGPANGVAIFNGNGETIGTKGNSTRLVTIYLPKENKLVIESKYADVTIPDNLNKLTIDITNGNLETQDINSFTLRSKYGNVSTGNLQSGEIEFINGHLSIKDADDIDLDTKYSTVDVATANKINMISTNDDYDIEEVGNLQGQKNYGNLRIAKLDKSLEMDGTNADVKVRNIAAGAEVIRIDNKYSDIRLPLKTLKNYTINYSGPYSTIYGNFDKQPYSGKAFKSASAEEALAEKIKNKITESLNGEKVVSDDKFTAVVGSGKGTSIDMRCQNCTVDFK